MNKKLTQRVFSLFLCVVLCLLPVVSIPADAATVNYVYSGSYVYNWGTRGEVATFLSPMAEEFYEDNNITYEDLASLSGSATLSAVPSSPLYKKLQTLMASNHTHETSYAETRYQYCYTDCQQSGGAISSFYSGKSIGPAWDSGNTWNREHTWPNSKGLGGADENDIMMLRPTAKSENGARSNKAYGESSGYYHPNTESGGAYDVRGDVARIFLYVYVRWGNVNGNGKYTTWGISGVMESREILLKWAEADPVDTWELGRNDAVEAITGTRNVFVDYPELIFLLFGASIPENMATPSGNAYVEECTHEQTSVLEYKAPTCTARGYTVYLCEQCGVSYADSFEPALDHEMGQWEVTLYPTTSTEGEQTRTCQRTGCTYSETETLPVAEFEDGWANDDGSWYYYQNGMAVKAQWLKVSGTWYYLDDDGVMVTGWLSDGGKWYYFSAGGAMQTGWVNDGGKWYYLNSAMHTGWLNDGGKWYYLNTEMKTGWVKSGNYWYYLLSNGKMAADQWVGGNGKWYFVDGNGRMLENQWLLRSGKWYYLGNNGLMVTGTHTINGTEYTFNDSGVWVG